MVAAKRRQDWQMWCLESIDILQDHIHNNRTCLLLQEPPTSKMTYIAQLIQKSTVSINISLVHV